jgi:hypothetical protein
VKVERFEIVSAFRRDDTVVLACGPSLRELSEQFAGRLISLNVPDRAPPELPRLVVRFEGMLLQVGLNRFQIVLEPPQHIATSYIEALQYCKNRSFPLLESLLSAKAIKYEWSGVIAVLAVPQDLATTKSALGAAGIIFPRLTKLDWDTTNLASFRLQAGYKNNDYFRNYILEGYEVRSMEIDAPLNVSRIEIDPTDFPVSEVGFNLTLDVNNKPCESKSTPLPDLSATLTEHERAFLSLETDLNLGGLL